MKLEDEIFKKLQTKLTAEKAAQYSDKLRKEQTDKIREVERSLAKVDNDIAKARLDIFQRNPLLMISFFDKPRIIRAYLAE